MWRKNRRILSVFLVVFIVFSGLVGCTENNTQFSSGNIDYIKKQDKTSGLQQAKEKLLTEWFRLLETNEEIYSDIFRILEYTDNFLLDQSWESLLRARAVCSAAMEALQKMEFPVMELTEEEINLLLDADVEISAVQREFEELENVRFDMSETLSLLNYTLEDDVFLTAGVTDTIPAMVEYYQEYFTLEYRYLSRFTNYLLLQLDCADIWESWKEQLPCMAVCADVWYEQTDELESATSKLLDNMEALPTKMSGVLGTSEYILEIIQEAVENGNLEVLQREICEISGVPGYYPIPYWLMDERKLYLVTDQETQEMRQVQAGEELALIPTACYISCGAISIEEIEDYSKQLEQWGIRTYGTWNDTKDTYHVLAQSGSSNMMIEWTSEETLLYLTEPLGCLIPELYLYAIASK